MYMTVRGIVLRVTDYNDRDALLTLLTARHGKLTVKARGLRRKNSPLVAPCQLLAYGEFTIFEYRGQYTINEAHSIELFTPLRRDLTKLSLGTYFAQAAEVLSQEDYPSSELQSLGLNCLYALASLDLSEAQIKSVVESSSKKTLNESLMNIFWREKRIDSLISSSARDWFVRICCIIEISLDCDFSSFSAVNKLNTNFGSISVRFKRVSMSV